MDDPLAAWRRLEARQRRTQAHLERAGAALQRSLTLLDGAQRVLNAAQQQLMAARVLRSGSVRPDSSVAGPPPNRVAQTSDTEASLSSIDA